MLSTSVGFRPVDVSCYLPLDIYISFHPHSDLLFFQEANDIVRVLFFNSKDKLFRKYVCQEVAIESHVQFFWKDSRCFSRKGKPTRKRPCPLVQHLFKFCKDASFNLILVFVQEASNSIYFSTPILIISARILRSSSSPSI